MLGIILMYFIGKQFYKLAEEFDKNRWLFSILGILTYYAGQVLFVLVLFLSDTFLTSDFITTMTTTTDELKLSVIAIPIGLLTCAALYFLLRKNWKKTGTLEENLIDEIGRY